MITESLKRYKDTSVEEDDVDQPYWKWDKEGKGSVVLPRGHLEATKRYFKNPKDYNRYWHHPFYGVIPHESDEAELTKRLITDPSKYKDRINPRFFNKLKTLPSNELKKMYGKSSKDLDKAMDKTKTTGSGGEAHDILANRNRDAYYKKALKHDDAIENIRQKLSSKHHLKGRIKASDIWRDK